jgi:two-component system, NarL family, sensor kinase
MRKSLLFLLLLTAFALSQAQNQKVDSLLNLVQNAKRDSNTVKLYLNIGNQYETNQPETAKAYYRKAKALSEQIGYPTGQYRFAVYYSGVLRMQGKYDSALVVNQEALKVAQAMNNQVFIAQMHYNIGNCYNQMKDFDLAMNHYLEALPVIEKTGNKGKLSMLYNALQVLCHEMKRYSDGIGYGEKAVSLMSDQPNSLILGYALMNLGNNYVSSNVAKSGKAIQLYTDALRIVRLNKNQYLESGLLINIANYYGSSLGEYNKARPFYAEALTLNKQLGFNEQVCTNLHGIALCDMNAKDYVSAKKSLQEALALARKNDFTAELKDIYELLGEIALAQNDFQQYRLSMRKSDSINSALINEEKIKATKTLEVKFETQKKQAEIQSLQQDKKLRNVFIAGLLVALLLLTALGTLYLNSQKRKRQLTEKEAELKAQRISELEKEKKLTASQSLLEGENAERKRLARDLHDGLGGMLSVVKLNLVNMKGNAILPEADLSVFRNALEMLDGSIRELRRVAHNLMPESLMRYGLKPALSDFCGSVSHVNLHFFGEERRLEEKFEVTAFRIVQELVNNAIKHSEASQVNVQVIIESDRLNLVVQDNGKGFDPAKTDTTQTTGLSSIRSRVESLGGQMELISSPGRGTEVQVDLRI